MGQHNMDQHLALPGRAIAWHRLGFSDATVSYLRAGQWCRAARDSREALMLSDKSGNTL